ncbi:hypothetical protein DPMN_086596 [Dreissena polymorpha]|uniref:Uncharacterized protein n=1 Tax=Dreissena polymorpha TaxID=45954 RepID=A0A9D4KRH6_DREPO|nr:hypothetical protein DPMN_086596 [Dreissena polymorpha]
MCVFPIAVKFQVTMLAAKCKTQVIEWIKNISSSSETGSLDERHILDIQTCLQILAVSTYLNLADVESMAINTITQYGSAFILKRIVRLVRSWQVPVAEFKYTNDAGQRTCADIFQELPISVQLRIMEKRLRKVDVE